MLGEFIENKERIPEGIKKLQAEEELYIYGNGPSAEWAYEQLMQWDVHIYAVIVSDKYYTQENFHGIKVLPFSEIKNKNINIIIGYDISKYADLHNELIHADNIDKMYYLNGFWLFLLEGKKLREDVILIDDYYKKLLRRNLNYDYFQQNIDAFTQTYDWLSDDKSKETMKCYLKGHIELKDWCTLPVWEETDSDKQYFADNVIYLTQNETIVDCGAYTGDSLESFCERLDTFDKYYACEPDSNVLEKLHKTIQKFSERGNIIHVPKGIGAKKERVSFSNLPGGCAQVMSGDEGDSYIEVDCIDNIVDSKDKISFIKMDIEGAEMSALQGAEMTIKKYKPKLAICAYHKREDLITIPQYIKSLVPEYKLFLRAHYPTAGELVLYAVCDKDIVS